MRWVILYEFERWQMMQIKKNLDAGYKRGIEKRVTDSADPKNLKLLQRQLMLLSSQ